MSWALHNSISEKLKTNKFCFVIQNSLGSENESWPENAVVGGDGSPNEEAIVFEEGNHRNVSEIFSDSWSLIETRSSETIDSSLRTLASDSSIFSHSTLRSPRREELTWLNFRSFLVHPGILLILFYFFLFFFFFFLALSPGVLLH